MPPARSKAKVLSMNGIKLGTQTAASFSFDFLEVLVIIVLIRVELQCRMLSASPLEKSQDLNKPTSSPDELFELVIFRLLISEELFNALCLHFLQFF